MRWDMYRARARALSPSQVRLKTARDEMAYLDNPSKKGFFDIVIVNDDLDKSYAELKAYLRA